MDKGRIRAIFVCQQCGRESPKWLGRCPNCDGWNTFLETSIAASMHGASSQLPKTHPSELSQIAVEGIPRLAIALPEFNRVLGGGIVPGSLVLIGGNPGIGKSTLLLQVSEMAARQRKNVLYVSGEESIEQVRLRANRLGLRGEGLYILAETSLEAILGQLDQAIRDLVVIDSI